MLEHDNVMMLDTRTEICMWLGKDASNAEKRSAMATAINFLKSNGRNPDTTAIHIIKDGHEGKSNPVWNKTFSN
jgi:hypothetical protein